MNAPDVKPVLRLLYLPNEPTPCWQAGARAAFEAMRRDGLLDAYEVFSFMQEWNTAADAGEWRARLLRAAEAIQPTVIFWQHIQRYPITSDFLQALRSLPSRPFLAYHEGDAYSRIRRRPTPSMTLLARHADLVFAEGLGGLAQIHREAGAREVLWMPACADTVHFGKPWNPRRGKRRTVVMIGNRMKERALFAPFPPLRFPGAREREQFAVRLHRRIGNRLTVYGRGWERHSFAAGPLPYTEQERVIRRHALSVNWDHFPGIPFYFSNRLPNSLISGVPHATTCHPGFELLFRNGEEILLHRSIDEAVDIVDWALCQPEADLIEIGLAGARLARKHLTYHAVYRGMMKRISERLQPGR